MSDIYKQALCLSESATDAEAIAAVHALNERANKADGLQLALTEVTGRADKAEATVLELSEWQWSHRLTAAVADGRIECSDESKARYRKVVEALGEDEAHKVFRKAGALPIEAVGNEPMQRAEGSGAEAAMAEITTLAKSLEANEGLDPLAAYNKATQQVLSDPTKASALGHNYKEA